MQATSHICQKMVKEKLYFLANCKLYESSEVSPTQLKHTCPDLKLLYQL